MNNGMVLEGEMRLGQGEGLRERGSIRAEGLVEGQRLVEGGGSVRRGSVWVVGSDVC